MKNRVTEILAKVATQLVLLFFTNLLTPIRGRFGLVTVVPELCLPCIGSKKGVASKERRSSFNLLSAQLLFSYVIELRLFELQGSATP